LSVVGASSFQKVPTIAKILAKELTIFQTVSSLECFQIQNNLEKVEEGKKMAYEEFFLIISDG
jgi:hypothetical protein